MAGSERTITALRALADALLAMAEELPILADRCTELAAELEGGSALGPAMDAEQRPLIVTR
ncbi:MAG TPA: hypothetical protein VGR90_04830, partial [Acidimicrobiales bacterium]|nr:hypothetical protein [Acidimicrobiales bacterium]